MNHPQPAPGNITLGEILSQPRCWAEALASLKAEGTLEKLCRQFPPAGEWLFIGCGSSYYVAMAAAASWTHLTGLPARAVPASEVLLFPELVLAGPCQPVLISRSGSTSEVLRAADYLECKRNIRTLAISCAKGQPLEAMASAALLLLPADEKSTVMTRSFTSMILGVQALAATARGNADYFGALERMPIGAQRVLDAINPKISQLVASGEFANYAFLAQGPLFGLASEGHLKVKEMSCSTSQAYHTMEFRHGPKSVVTPEMLLTFLMSETSYEAEREVLEEMKGLGGTTFVITNKACDRVRRAADLLIELKLDVPEFARLPVNAFAGQLLGQYTGLKKGLDPDNPRNLSRVVVLNQ
jgi:glutamine---fructose-6-phosphate transaminase (isomerizing)